MSFASNRRYLLAAGTSLSCVLQTKIVTSYPGITLCQLTKDLYSDNGETLLARRGAMLMGEQNKVMTQGVARVFVNWTNLKDGNVNVKIGALGTDGLGASGLPAWIDNHIFQRYSGAIMLSLLGDGMDILKIPHKNRGITAILPMIIHLIRRRSWLKQHLRTRLIFLQLHILIREPFYQ